MPALISTVTYQIIELLEQDTQTAQIEQIEQQQTQLAAQRTAIIEAKRHTEAHLNALAQRMGHLQAQVMRLDALGGRLTSMAGIDTKEFNFSRRPALGGPAEPVASATQSDLFRLLNSLDSQVSKQSE